MKKVLLIIISILFLSILIQKKNAITYQNKSVYNINKKYIIDIKYPYFNSKKLNGIIKDYLNQNIISFKNKISNNKKDYLYIDYDIISQNKVLLYQYISQNSELKTTYYELNISKHSFQPINFNIKQEEKVSKQDDKIIAFTFDDGPCLNTRKIVDILVSYNATATFFMLGNKAIHYPETVLYVQASGMEIGNHTYSHQLLTRESEEEIREEINETNKIIFDITGTYPELFRPSYGTVSKKIKNVSTMPLIIWNLDTLDWKYHNSKKIADKILKRVRDGDIILMHDTYHATTNALSIVIPKLQSEGYRIVSVSELFNIKKKEPKLGFYYGSVN